MQLIVDYPEHNIYSSFVYADAELRESNGGAVVVTTVKIPLTSTSEQLFDKYTCGKSLRIKLKNGDEWKCISLCLMEGTIYFPRTCDKNDEPSLYLWDAERIA
ncbi:hypothetical protein [Escherichia coli]|uniref:hypothetical protein n=1 Tax=Escherichia coli TaxID=562 RepID=UPI0034C6B892